MFTVVANTLETHCIRPTNLFEAQDSHQWSARHVLSHRTSSTTMYITNCDERYHIQRNKVRPSTPANKVARDAAAIPRSSAALRADPWHWYNVNERCPTTLSHIAIIMDSKLNRTSCSRSRQVHLEMPKSSTATAPVSWSRRHKQTRY